MNPEEQPLLELESALRQLSPSEPSEQFTARLFAAFETPTDAAPADFGQVVAPPRPSASWFQPFAAAAAVAVLAGVVAMLGLNRPGDSKPAGSGTSASSPVKFVPSHAQKSYEGSRFDDGIVLTENSQPMRTVRHQFIDSYTWENPADGSRVEIRVPVERVRYVPVQTD